MRAMSRVLITVEHILAKSHLRVEECYTWTDIYIQFQWNCKKRKYIHKLPTSFKICVNTHALTGTRIVHVQSCLLLATAPQSTLHITYEIERIMICSNVCHFDVILCLVHFSGLREVSTNALIYSGIHSGSKCPEWWITSCTEVRQRVGYQWP